MCTVTKKAGEACMGPFQCEAPLECSRTTRTCADVRTGKEGAACTQEEGEPQDPENRTTCLPGLFCVNGICTAPAQQG